MKVGFVAADNGGSAFYRVIQPHMICKNLYDATYYANAGRGTSNEQMTESDIVLIQRQEHATALKGMQDLKNKGKLVITDIDDNLWAIPRDVIDLKTFWTKERLKGFEQTLEICDAVTTTTPLLAKNVSKFNKNVHIVPNLVGAFEYGKPQNHAIRIGWGGSATHLPDFTKDITDVLLKLKQEYKTKIELIMLGVTPLELIGHSTFYGFVLPYRYLQFLRMLNLDIGIIPCLNNFFNEGRSNVKYLEWGAIKAATVASPVASYINSIKQGVSGFIAYKPKQWYQYLKLLIEDENLRIKVGQNAFNFVYENYSVEKKSTQYNIYKELYERKNDGHLNFNSDTKETV